jgi:peptidyl-prolyl cis-trans isomerase B (cyclophilin B)
MDKVILIISTLAFFLLGCGYKKEIEELTRERQQLKQEIRSLKGAVEDYKKIDERLKFLVSKMKGIKARILTNKGKIDLEFFPDKAPIHCFNFIIRAESGFYDKTQFHRIIPNFMIQGGDPNTKDKDPYNDGQGGPLVNIPHEFNPTRHSRGILSMARVGNEAMGAGCQFFIMHGDSHHLDNKYTAFGRVTQGMAVVDKIANVKKNSKDPRLRDRPLHPVVIKTIEVFR